MSPAMRHWVTAIVSLIKRLMIWFGGYLLQPSVREMNELVQQTGEMPLVREMNELVQQTGEMPSVREMNKLVQQTGEMQQKQDVAPGSKRKGKKKKQTNRDKNIREQAEAPSGQSQSKIKELELQPAEMKLKQQEELVPQEEIKSRPCDEPMEKNLRSELEEKIKEIGRLQEIIRVNLLERLAQNDQIARQSKLVQDLWAEVAFLKQLQPVGEDDQTGVPVIHDLNPGATEGEQPRIQFGTVGMEIEVPSFESEAKTNKMLVAARTKPKNSEDENKSVEEGLRKPHQPFSRKSSFSSEASVPLVDLSGVVAEGLQPLSDAKDATITTQIDKEINKKPTDIEWKVLSNYDLELRQLLSDANNAQITKQLDKTIEPNLQPALRGGHLSKIEFSFSILLRALWIIRLEVPNRSDIDNPEWLDRHHLTKFRQESGRNWLKENLEPGKADEKLKFLEEAATASLGNAGRLLVPLYKSYVQTNHQVHPTLDYKVILYSNEGTYTFDGEDLREVVQFLAGLLLKKQAS